MGANFKFRIPDAAQRGAAMVDVIDTLPRAKARVSTGNKQQRRTT
jgi:hypothetical protein